MQASWSWEIVHERKPWVIAVRPLFMNQTDQRPELILQDV